VESACRDLVTVARSYEPEPELAERYNARYEQHRKIYPACKDLFPLLH